MGMFDSVWVNCKECGNKVEFQSKVGECCLHDYTINNAPPEILIDLNGEVQFCEKCNYPNELNVQVGTFVTIS